MLEKKRKAWVGLISPCPCTVYSYMDGLLLHLGGFASTHDARKGEESADWELRPPQVDRQDGVVSRACGVQEERSLDEHD